MITQRRIFTLLVCTLFVVSGCDSSHITLDLSPVQTGNSPQVHTGVEFADWTAVTTGVEVKQIEYTADTAKELFTIVRANTNEASIKTAVNEQDSKTVDEWQTVLGATVVINGSYFDEKYELTTRTIVDGKEYGPLLSADTSGLAYTLNNQTWKIISRQNIPKNTPQYGIQSYPLLVNDSLAQIDSSAIDPAQRTIIAQDDAYIYFIVAEYGVLSLQELDDALVELVNPTMALNLDGGTSTGMSIHSDSITYGNSSVVIPAVVYIE